jgi:exopolysaccharide production protein ExoZ
MLQSIQVARALAVIGVLICHLEWVRNDIRGAAPFGDGWLLMGHGVDLFFCISGFIIAHLLKARPISSIDFFFKRIVRIYPLYWAFTLSYVFATYFACQFGQRDNCGIIHNFTDVVNSLLILPQASEPLLSVGWSLEHEIIFYAIAGIVCVVFRMPIGRLLQIIALLGCAGVIVHVVIPGVTGIDPWDYHLFSLYHFEFAAGIAVFMMKDRLANVNVLMLAAFGALTFLATGMATELVPGPAQNVEVARAGVSGLVSVLGYSVASAAILSGLVGAEAQGRFKRGSNIWSSFVTALVLIGNASYALYLVQPLAYGLIGKAYRATHVDAAFLVPALAAALGATLIIGTSWYLLAERPFLRAAHRILAPASQASV